MKTRAAAPPETAVLFFNAFQIGGALKTASRLLPSGAG